MNFISLTVLVVCIFELVDATNGYPSSHGSLTLNRNDLVTAVVSSSSRPQDADLSSLNLLVKVVVSVQKLLGPHASTVTVAFDGPNPKLSRNDTANYYRKIALFQDWVIAQPASISGSLRVWINDAWTHQANMVKRVVDEITSSHKMTSVLFFTQDDSEVVGEVDTEMILHALQDDPQVQYVRFYWQQDCRADMFLSLPMCDPNVTRNSGLLVNTPWYSDRPHFATSSFYTNNIWPKISEDARNTPEVVLERKLVTLKTMWMYGLPGQMYHDVNHMSWSHNMEVRIENVVQAEVEKKAAKIGSASEKAEADKKATIFSERGNGGDLVQRRQVRRRRRRRSMAQIVLEEQGGSARKQAQTKVTEEGGRPRKRLVEREAQKTSREQGRRRRRGRP